MTVQLARGETEKLIYGTRDTPRYTQDSPVLPDVWIEYGLNPLEPMDLLLTPHFSSSPGAVARHLRERLEAMRGFDWTNPNPEESGPEAPGGGPRGEPNVVYTQAYVAVSLYLDELVQLVLPMTPWWGHNLQQVTGDKGDRPFAVLRDPTVSALILETL